LSFSIEQLNGAAFGACLSRLLQNMPPLELLDCNGGDGSVLSWGLMGSVHFYLAFNQTEL
jgi:hypothetical protein